MAGVNKVRRLPAELRDLVHELLDKGTTVDDVTAALQELGADVSRSGVGRYRKQWQEAMQELAEVREFSRMAVRDLDKQPESHLTRLNAHYLETALFRAQMALRAQFEKDPESAIKLITKASMAQMLLARAQRDNAETTIKADGYAEEKQETQEQESGDRTIQVTFVPVPTAVDTPKTPDNKDA